MKEMTKGQIESWYHSKILRIPHGKQNPTKRYLNEEQIYELFDGDVYLFEKVDGKLNSIDASNMCLKQWFIFEDMTGKNTCHKHVMKYKILPIDKKIYLDRVRIGNNNNYYITPYFLPMDFKKDNLYIMKLNLNLSLDRDDLDKGTIKSIIYPILDLLAKRHSVFGSKKMEGIVIKNYKKQLFGKWINDEFEDKIKKSKKGD